MSELKSAIARRALLGMAWFAVLLGLVLFIPAWTLRFWQAWVYWTVSVVAAFAMVLYFLRRDPALMERRSRSPMQEKDRAQTILVGLMMLAFLAEDVVPAFDRRLHWSAVTWPITVVAQVLVVLSFVLMFLALRENTFASVLVTVDSGQTVIATGPYAVVRHPYYSGMLLMSVFTPPALGSWWGLAAFPVMLLALVLRVRREERFLAANLAGYKEYRLRTTRRLIPLAW